MTEDLGSGFRICFCLHICIQGSYKAIVQLLCKNIWRWVIIILLICKPFEHILHQSQMYKMMKSMRFVRSPCSCHTIQNKSDLSLLDWSSHKIVWETICDAKLSTDRRNFLPRICILPLNRSLKPLSRPLELKLFMENFNFGFEDLKSPLRPPSLPNCNFS